MSTITLEQLATMTVDFLGSDKTNSESSVVLAKLTHAMLNEEDSKEFTQLVATGAAVMLAEAFAEALA